jgi:hypothetical protein
VRTAFDEGQRQAVARVLRQLADALVEVVRLVQQRLAGGFVRDLRQRVVADQGHALAAHQVDGAVTCDGHHPRQRASAARLVLRGPLPDAHVDVLQCLLGHAAPAQHAQQACEQDGRGLVVELPERGGIVRGAALQQLGELDLRRQGFVPVHG